MIRKKVRFLEVRQCGQLCANFHSATVKETSYTVRRLAKF